MTRIPVLTAVMLLLVLANCQSGSGDAEQASTQTVQADNRSGAGSTTAGNAAAALAAEGGEAVQFTTDDGVVIHGTLYAAGKGAPAVLCLHQWRSDRSSFAALAAQLQKEGFTVLTIDMRGYGESTKTTSGKSVRPDRKAQKDVAAAMAFLRANDAADPNRVGIIGASYGSSNALIYAAGDARIKALVLLSPGLNYFNELPTEQPLKQYKGRPLFAVASSEDVRSAETVQKYESIAPGIQVKMFDGAGHGTDILDARVGLDRDIIAFLRKNL